MEYHSSDIFNDDLIREARTWLGTKFQHHAQIKQDLPQHSGGCDCAGLILGIAKILSIKSKVGGLISDYSFQYAHKPDQTYLLKQLDMHLMRSDNLTLGSVVVIKMAGEPQHLCLVADHIFQSQKTFTLIHANENIGCVIEQPLNKFLRAEITSIYNFIR